VERARKEGGGPNHYRALLELAGETKHTAEQIEKDLPRTFAADERVEPGSERAEQLRRVLAAFAAHCPRIGYVQAMNFIVAFLFAHGLPEEPAFWCLTTLVNEIVPGYFDVGMPNAQDDQRVFSAMLLELLPAVGVHIQSIAAEDILTGFMSSQWLLTLFINVLPTHSTARLWDLLAWYRSRRVLLAACTALIAPHEEDLLATSDMCECIELLQSIGPQMNDADAFAERVKLWTESVLTEDWLRECQSWQERDFFSPLSSELHTRGLERQSEMSSLERELEPFESSSSRFLLDRHEGDALRQALVHSERTTCECGQPLRDSATSHVREFIISPLQLLQSSDVFFHQERIRVAQEHFQQSCQRMHAYGASCLRLDLLSNSLLECWEQGMPEHAIAEAEALLSETSEAFDSLAKFVTSLMHFVSNPVTGHEKMHVSENRERALDLLTECANRNTERIRKNAISEAQQASEELKALRERKSDILRRVEERQSLHEHAVMDWAKKAQTRRELDMDKAQATIRTYLSIVGDKFGSKCSAPQEWNAHERNGCSESADKCLSGFNSALNDEMERTDDALSLLSSLDNSVRERQQRLQREEELSKHAREWISVRRRELNACKDAVSEQSRLAEEYYAKQLEDSWLDKVKTTTYALQSTSERLHSLLQRWLAEAFANVLDARRFVCFEYVRLIDAATAIINDVEEQLLPQLPENHDSKGECAAEEDSEINSANSKYQRSGFFGRISNGKTNNSASTHQHHLPQEDQSNNQQHSFTPVADALAMMKRLRRPGSLNPMHAGTSEASAMPVNGDQEVEKQDENQQQQQQTRNADASAAVKADLLAFQRRREILQSRKAELRRLLDQIDTDTGR
jgi:hypothetical protein